MAFATIGGANLHFRLSGPQDGPQIVLANSLGTDARIWDAMISEISGHYRVLSYDKRGHGLSDGPLAALTIDDHVVDLVGLVDHAGFERFALAGVSVGGMIAQRFAARYPARIAALVLCDTAASIGSAQMWDGRVDAVRTDGLASISEAVLGRWFAPAFKTTHPAEYAGWRTMLERMSSEGYCATCITIRNTDLTGELAAITAPTLVVAGQFDLSTPPELVRATAERIAGARFEIIADAGHIPSIEQPKVLAELLVRHFQECGHV